jgi:hypothetical protein
MQVGAHRSNRGIKYHVVYLQTMYVHADPNMQKEHDVWTVLYRSEQSHSRTPPSSQASHRIQVFH